MNTQIIPVRRAPKKLELLDYRAGNSNLNVGQLVRIPFRNSKILGIVYRLDHETDLNEEKLKPITSIVQKEPFFSQERLNFLKKISDIYNISLSTQIKLALPPLQKRKLKKVKLNNPTTKQYQQEAEQPFFQLYTTKAEHREVYKNLSEHNLVLIPELRFKQRIQNVLNENSKEKIVFWHSELSQKEKFTRWMQIRNQEKTTVIGTRSAVFLPFQKLNKIILDYEHAENHKHWDQDPRFYNLDIAEELSKLHGSDITITGFSPSCRSYYNIYKENYSYKQGIKNKISELYNKKEIDLIDMSQERKAGNYDIFSSQAKKKLLSSTQGSSFIFLNRLGYARSIECEDCGFTLECQSCGLPMIYSREESKMRCHYCSRDRPVPSACPECEGEIIELRGWGTERIEAKIKNILPKEDKRKIIRIDSKTEVNQIPEGDKIIIGTQKALAFLDWSQIELILFVNIDVQLRLAEFKASEKVWHLIQEIQFFRNGDSTFHIQSLNPDQLVLKSINQPDRFYRTDLNSRKNLHYPPYNHLVRFFYGAQKQSIAKQKADKLYSKLSKKLTKSYKTNIIISEPMKMCPEYFRDKYWSMLLLKLPKHNWKEELIWLNEEISDEWKVDPAPKTILSP